MQDALVDNRPEIRVNGKSKRSLLENIKHLIVTSEINEPSSCQLVVNNWGQSESGFSYLFDDDSLVDFGSELRVDMPYRTQFVKLFTGKIWIVESVYPESSLPEINLTAYDELKLLDGPKHTRNFLNLAFGEIIEQIASEHGLPVQKNIIAEDPVQESLAQMMESDLDFICRLAAIVGWHLSMDGQVLKIEEVIERENPLEFVYGQSLHALKVRADLLPQRSEIRLSSWGINKTSLIGTAGKDNLIDLADGLVTGADLVNTAFFQHRERKSALFVKDEATLQRFARSEYQDIANGFLVGFGYTDGNPELIPGKLVTLIGLGEKYEGDYYVVKTRHIFNVQTGYHTEFWVVRPGYSKPNSLRSKLKQGDNKLKKTKEPRPTDTTIVSVKPHNKEA